MSRSASLAGAVPALRLPTGGTLALDLSSVVGWAYGRPGIDPAPCFGTWPLDPDHVLPEGGRFAAFENELASMMIRTEPTHMILEASFSLEAMYRNSNYRIMCQQITLRGIALSEAYRGACGHSEIDPGTVRAEVMGQRRYSRDTVKREVMRYCRERGWRVPDHNAGDACLLWEWYRMRIAGAPPVAGPLWRHAARGTLQ